MVFLKFERSNMISWSIHMLQEKMRSVDGTWSCEQHGKDSKVKIYWRGDISRRKYFDLTNIFHTFECDIALRKGSNFVQNHFLIWKSMWKKVISSWNFLIIYDHFVVSEYKMLAMYGQLRRFGDRSTNY